MSRTQAAYEPAFNVMLSSLFQQVLTPAPPTGAQRWLDQTGQGAWKAALRDGVLGTDDLLAQVG